MLWESELGEAWMMLLFCRVAEENTLEIYEFAPEKKASRIPKGKDRLTIIIFQGRTVKFRWVYML